MLRVLFEPMVEMTMLDLDTALLFSVAEALQDNSFDSSWWVHPESGDVPCWVDDLAEYEGFDHPDEPEPGSTRQ